MHRVLYRDVLGIIKGCTGYYIGMHGVLLRDALGIIKG
jgi:hypothetical protein